MEKVYFRYQILERSSISEYWNIFDEPEVQYYLEMWYLHSLECASVIQKLPLLEHNNGL